MEYYSDNTGAEPLGTTNKTKKVTCPADDWGTSRGDNMPRRGEPLAHPGTTVRPARCRGKTNASQFPPPCTRLDDGSLVAIHHTPTIPPPETRPRRDSPAELRGGALVRDSLRLYLTDVGKLPLLDDRQEKIATR